MMFFHIPLLVILLNFQDSARAPVDCKEWHECRQLALDAADRQDYETFHDLAWRAVQTGPKNDPALMYLLARAQSLSGRPGDALVMLQRLAHIGSKTDAATNADFRRVRALPGWADMAGTAPSTTPAAASETAASTATPPASPVTAAAPTMASADSLRFTTTPLAPAGLAYDAVSRRFIVGDRDARRLTVVDEFSQHVANLASAQSAGFGNIAALEIDPRQGNLWVVSGGDGTSTPDPPVRTTLHKLQLISGRVLESFGLEVRQAMNLLVLVTTTGSAQPIAAGIDYEDWPEVVGTIAGDDNVLIICPDEKRATLLKTRIEGYLG